MHARREAIKKGRKRVNLWLFLAQINGKIGCGLRISTMVSLDR
jgi:hypothetical protein